MDIVGSWVEFSEGYQCYDRRNRILWIDENWERELFM